MIKEINIHAPSTSPAFRIWLVEQIQNEYPQVSLVTAHCDKEVSHCHLSVDDVDSATDEELVDVFEFTARLLEQDDVELQPMGDS